MILLIDIFIFFSYTAYILYCNIYAKNGVVYETLHTTLGRALLI